MSEQTAFSFQTSASLRSHAAVQPAGIVDASRHPFDNVERLPFSVRVVRTAEDLEKAVAIRHSAYARHLPDFAEKLRAPEEADWEEGVAVLLAESKIDGSPLGSMRIQSNQFRQLSLEQSVELPRSIAKASLAEVTRLGIVSEGVGSLVKTTLIKASFQYCQQLGIDWAIVTARSPLDRQYERLMFEDLFPGRGFIPMQHVHNLPHRVLGFNIHTGEARWSQAKHPLLKFFCYTDHPDIDIHLPRLDEKSISFAHAQQSWGAIIPGH